MLLEIYFIDEEGEEIKTEPSDVTLTHKSLAIIISHTDRRVFVFKGRKVTIVQKFASARRASALRLQHGYNITHVEEWEGIDQIFIPVLDYLGGIVDDGEPDEAVKPAAPKPTAKSEAAKEYRAPIMLPLKKKPEAAPPKKPAAAKPKKTTKKATKPKASTGKISEDLPPKLVKVVKTMSTLEPPTGSECDYVLVGNKLYILTSSNKNDLRKGEIKFEEVTTLPEGVFPAENYFPRMLVASKKVIAVEFWAKR
ncbi:MAG: hypothetical protein ACTSO7_05010 [Candidatus Heimdallarchaeota archaeon]